MASRRGFNKPGRARSGLRSQVSVLATTEEAEEVAKPRAMAMELEGAAAMAEDREGVGWNTEESDEDVQDMRTLGLGLSGTKRGLERLGGLLSHRGLQQCQRFFQHTAASRSKDASFQEGEDIENFLVRFERIARHLGLASV
ncbi:unnamed protein product [Pleuronectes platessa]|uniref:Uncharacterized protein n=1 Tax=Pleuronectes platessa TaxID=8262 RepID=A0A9N7UXT5_PLEPL|nr:unnamed protein product [Pleuronectes platessa]